MAAPEVQQRMETLLDLDVLAPQVRRDVSAALLHGLGIRHPLTGPCDCGACCETCGHYPDCISFDLPEEMS